MGITRHILKLLLQESNRCSFYGTLLTLGRQEFKDELSDISEWIDGSISIENIESHKLANHIFEHLGFDKIIALDISDYEGADLLLDLNERLPDNLNDSFDVILNSGTLEHIFHIPNVLFNLTRIVKTGGRIIHCAPASGFINHGYYMFSPNFFLEYYQKAKFIINTLLLVKLDKKSQQYLSVYDCLAPHEPIHQNSNEKYGVFCVVTKTADSVVNVVPQQRFFQVQWQIDS